MSVLIDGIVCNNEMSVNAHGGTEMMIDRIKNSVPQDYLNGVAIHFSRVRDIPEDKINILAFHDLPNDPEMSRFKDANLRSKFDKFVFVSNWQMQLANLYLGIPYSDSVVINNGIEPIIGQGDTYKIFDKFKDIDSDKTINLIYHTTPHRGLEIATYAVDVLSKKYPIHFDVYSSFKAYGWEERDKPYLQLFDFIKNHKNMTYHGWQPNTVIRNALNKSHIFAYPNIWQETSCIALIEAMSAGNLCVHPNYGALYETAANQTLMYQWNENPEKHAEIFIKELEKAIHLIYNNNAASLAYKSNIHSLNNFTWDNLKNKWIQLIKDLKSND